ncbi:MAG: hypothetical protein WC488_00160 [Candidatus Micrarchaeia archaeon]
MRRILLLLLFAVLAGSAFAAASNVSEVVKETEQGLGAVEAGSPFYSTGILNQWKELSVTLALIMVFLVGFARMIADPLNLPDLKAWANVEWAQTIVTVVIVLATIGCLVFVDMAVADEVNRSPGSPVQCDSSEFCLIKVSNVYLDGLINLSQESSRSAFTASVSAGSTASERQTFSCGTLLIPPCLWGYISWANNGFLILDVERYNQEIEMFGSIIYALGVQQFFVNKVAYLVGPVLLLIGIVGRGFFLTRRAGGMLMAVALGIMFVFPMMYLWNMITLNVAVYGDRLFAMPNPDCPKECGMEAPIAYSISDQSTGYYNITEIIEDNKPSGSTISESERRAILEGLENGSRFSYGNAGSCENISIEINSTHARNGHNNEFGDYYCPDYCRELPYPYSIYECSNAKVELACMEMPRGCKIVREVAIAGGSSDVCLNADNTPICPDDCKVIAPLNADCTSCFEPGFSYSSPVSAPFNCRIALLRQTLDAQGQVVSDISGRPESCTQSSLTDPTTGATYTNDYSQATMNCKADMDPAESCAYIVPEMPDCECSGPECCIFVEGVSDCANFYATTSGGNVTVSQQPSVDESPDNEEVVTGTDLQVVRHYECSSNTAGTCLNHPSDRFWNNNTHTCQCYGRNCSKPSARCNSCLDVPKDYCFFKPYVALSCAEDCTTGTFLKPALLTAAEFAKKSSEGMFGREDIKNVSRMLLPAYLLPLINIAVTLMFIRGFSPIFGGDFEIPGYAKVL